jgi:hypothetical protein
MTAEQIVKITHDASVTAGCGRSSSRLPPAKPAPPK